MTDSGELYCSEPQGPVCEGEFRAVLSWINFIVEVKVLLTAPPCVSLRKLYVALSVGVCLLISVLVLFFLFPRPVLLSPVTVESSVVFFVNSSVLINIVVGQREPLIDRRPQLLTIWTNSPPVIFFFFNSFTFLFFVEHCKHHQRQLCVRAGVQSVSAGPRLPNRGGNSLHWGHHVCPTSVHQNGETAWVWWRPVRVDWKWFFFFLSHRNGIWNKYVHSSWFQVNICSFSPHRFHIWSQWTWLSLARCKFVTPRNKQTFY